MTDTLTPPVDAAVEVRAFQIREVDTEARTVTGIAVPWDSDASIGGYYTERFARGAVQDSDDALLFWDHSEPIGRLTRAADTDAGWEITARISTTARAEEAYTLARDGVIDQFSVAFVPQEHRDEIHEDGSLTRTRTRVRVREVSLTPFPAYDGAKVSDVRSATIPTPTPKETPVTVTMTEPEATQLRADLDTTRGELDEMRRAFAEVMANAARGTGPTPTQYRSAGHLLKALAAGDEAAITEYNETLKRAWDPAGAVVADGTRTGAGWVGDLTRLVEEAAVLASLFSSSPLGDEGMTVEYSVLKTDTTKVEKQSAEGETLAFGKVSTKVESAPVETFGGYTRLSLQAIKRSSVNLLQHHLRAMALAAGRQRNATWRTVYAAAVAAQVTANKTVTVADSTDYKSWVDAIVDAAIMYTDLGLSLENLVADKTVFKTLAHLEGADGRPLMTVAGTGTNVVGELNLTSVSGNLGGVPVRLNPKQALPGASFTNRLAIREYATPLAQLQDANILNLSEDFSVYFFAAHAVEIPEAIVPVKITA